MAAGSLPFSIGQQRELLRILYNAYRTSLMNKKYYACRLSKLQSFDKWVNISVAIAAGAGGTLSIWEWKWFVDAVGQNVFPAIAASAGMVAGIKQLQGFEQKIENWSLLVLQHTKLSASLLRLIERVRIAQIVTSQDLESLEALQVARAELETWDDIQPKEKILKKCTDEVNKEIPVDSLWMPKEE